MRKIFIDILVVFAAFSLIGCEKGDSQKDLGFPVIYIPQATYTGLDNTYPVPAGPLNQYTTCNCNVKDGKLNVIIGVLRSGFVAERKAYSVSLGECQTETQRKLLEYGQNGTPAMALPAGTYTIPSRIEVPSGENGATCYVSIDLAALAAHKGEITQGGVCRLLVLGLEISNPTTYSLAEKNTSVVMVIDPASEYWGETPII